MRKFVGFVLSLFLFLTPVAHMEKSEASGFPVVDIAHISQSIIGYIQELADYVESLSNTALSTNQLTQMITDYTQVLQEYDDFLHQIRDLRGVISAGQWNDLMATIDRDMAQMSDFTLTSTLDPSDPDYATDLRDLLILEGDMAPRETDDILDIYRNDLNVPNSELAEMEIRIQRMQKAYFRYAAQQENVSLDRQARDDMAKKIRNTGIALSMLGEKSDLATLQMMAHIQLMQMEQNEMAMRQREVALQHYEPTSVVIGQQKIQSMNREAEKQKKAINKPNTGVGYDNFGKKYGL